MDNLYGFPRYYEIAMSFRDIPHEVDVFEECFRRFSRIPVKSVLEIACGNAPHLEELAKRGYRYTVLALSEAMIASSAEKAKRAGARAEFVRSRMSAFRIDPPVDFAYIMLGSLYVADTAELTGHFDSLAASLRPGGLYLMDWCLKTWGTPFVGESWDMEQDGIKVTTSGDMETVDAMAQTFVETIRFDVDDHGRHVKVEDRSVVRAVHPQEFLLMLKLRGDFEFVGWWNNWDLAQPLAGVKTPSRPITIIRRTG